MDCVCHGEPAYWHRDPRLLKGGSWRCRVRKREVDAAHSDAKNARMRERYDTDPVYRIEKNLHDHARRRKQTLARRRAAPAPDHGGT